MSHAQRTRRRRRAAGGGKSKVFLAFMVLGIVVVIAGLGAVGYVVHLAASAPPLASSFPAEVKVAATAHRSTTADAEPAPRGQSRYEDRSKRPKLGR